MKVLGYFIYNILFPSQNSDQFVKTFSSKIITLSILNTILNQYHYQINIFYFIFIVIVNVLIFDNTYLAQKIFSLFHLCSFL